MGPLRRIAAGVNCSKSLVPVLFADISSFDGSSDLVLAHLMLWVDC